jgi:hypothetical protein
MTNLTYEIEALTGMMMRVAAATTEAQQETRMIW